MTARTAPESDEVAGHQYRLAQARRVIRLCGELGVCDPEDLTPEAVASVCDERGKIKPEPQDMGAS